MEFVEVRRADVGNGAELHPTLAPVDPIVATLRTRLCGRIPVRCWPYKYIYDVLASAGHERSGCGHPVLSFYLSAKRYGSVFVKPGALDGGAQLLLCFHGRSALGTGEQVAFEICRSSGVQFAVDIDM